MNPEPCSRRKSSFLAACSHLRPRCRDGSAEWNERVRGCHLFSWFLARRRHLTSQTALILRSAGAHDVLSWLWKPPVPKVPLRNPTIVSFREKQLEDLFFCRWSCIEKRLCDAALRHQTSCYTLSPVIGGHSEVITLNGYVTETELGQIDGITPWAALYWQQITLLRSNKKNVNYRIKDAGYELLFSAFESSKMWHLDGTGPREQTAPIILETQPYILQKNHCPPSLQ